MTTPGSEPSTSRLKAASSSPARSPLRGGLSARVTIARGLGVVGVLLYNWWIVVAIHGNLLTNSDEFFSDLEAVGRPHATTLQHLDLAAGIVMVLALVLRGARSRGSARAEWPWLVGFALAGTLGGQFAYACSEALSATCRSEEWHLRLPAHHYVHVVAGVIEFATATFALYVAWRRTRNDDNAVARVLRGVGVALIVGYPLLALAYLSDAYGAFVEPIFFICFSTVAMVELFEES